LAPAVGNVALRSAAELGELRPRRRTELADILAEGLKLEKPGTPRAAISTHRQFELVDEKIVAQDGEIIEELLERALKEDIKLASNDPFFAPFLPARTRYELDEHRSNEGMALGKTNFNTQVAFSSYSEEFDDGSELTQKKLITAAQKPYYKRSMIRVSHWDGSQLHMFTRSVDNSSVELLKETAKRQFNYDFKAQDSTSMLGERLPLQIADGPWQAVADEIVCKADEILAERSGGKWHQGIKQESYLQALSYVESQTEVLDPLIGIGEQLAMQHGTFEDYQAAYQQKIYDAIALLEKRLELGKSTEKIIDYEATSAGAGALARAEGKSYDACGMVVSAETQDSVANQTSFESLKRLLNKKVNCPECTKKVVVPEDDLQAGKLTCIECGYWLDVCTGDKGFKKVAEKLSTKIVSGFEIISAWFRKDAQERKVKKLAQQKAYAELGNNVTYSDKKFYEKQIRGSLEAKAA
jgi:hypothetical protein